MMMDQDRISGAAGKAMGSVQETAGKRTGHTRLQAEGKPDNAEGRVGGAVGNAGEAARESRKA